MLWHMMLFGGWESTSLQASTNNLGTDICKPRDTHTQMVFRRVAPRLLAASVWSIFATHISDTARARIEQWALAVAGYEIHGARNWASGLARDIGSGDACKLETEVRHNEPWRLTRLAPRSCGEDSDTILGRTLEVERDWCLCSLRKTHVRYWRDRWKLPRQKSNCLLPVSSHSQC